MVYIQIKDGIRVSGTDRKTCPFYDEIDSILGMSRAATEPVALLESSSSAVPDIETIERNEPIQNEGA